MRRTLAALVAAAITTTTSWPAAAITCGGTTQAGVTWPPTGGTNCDSAHVEQPGSLVRANIASGQEVPVRWNGAWQGATMGCPPGYTLAEYHYDCNCSNSATWFACVRTGIDTTAFPAGTSQQRVD